MLILKLKDLIDEEVRVNANMIVFYKRAKNIPNGTDIYLSGTDIIAVKESPEEVDLRLSEAFVFMSRR
ncbi:hypothetical protein EBZ38_07610 [bacterium]|jgi:hypothetical protein|nr:hypothetical protein [bacterium]